MRGHLWMVIWMATGCATGREGSAFDAQHTEREELTPGLSGTLRVTHPTMRRGGDAVALSHDANERKSIYGQPLHVRRRAASRYLREDSAWMLVASHMSGLYEDPPPARVSVATLEQFAWVYADAHRVTTARSGDHLVRRREGRPDDPLLPESDATYFIRGSRNRFVFRRDAAGKMDALLHRHKGQDLAWIRLS